MLIEKESNVRSASNKLAALMDAKQRSNTAKQTYTAEQCGAAEAFYELARLAYFRSRVYLTYRDSFITVKIDKPAHADKISVAASNVDNLAESLKCEKVVTAQGIIYRIPR